MSQPTAIHGSVEPPRGIAPLRSPDGSEAPHGEFATAREARGFAEEVMAKTMGGSFGPPPPREFFHVTLKSNLENLQKTGLLPRIGERSEALGEEFDEEEELLLLKIEGAHVISPEATYLQPDAESPSGWNTSSEWTTEEPIPGEKITVEDEW